MSSTKRLSKPQGLKIGRDGSKKKKKNQEVERWKWSLGNKKLAFRIRPDIIFAHKVDF